MQVMHLHVLHSQLQCEDSQHMRTSGGRTSSVVRPLLGGLRSPALQRCCAGPGHSKMGLAHRFSPLCQAGQPEQFPRVSATATCSPPRRLESTLAG